MFLKQFFKGLIIGIGFIIPGLSGSVIAAVLGIYEEILVKIGNLFNDFKNNIIFLIPIILGFISGVLLFSNLILYFINKNIIFIYYIFIGCILGCIPYLTKIIKKRCHQRLSYLTFLLALNIGICLYIIKTNNLIQYQNISIFNMIISGFLYTIGKFVPGISGSALLIISGVYNYLLKIISNPFIINTNDLYYLIPFIISFILSTFFVIKLINYFLKNYFRYTYSAIIGFTLSSTLFLYPKVINMQSIIILICSFFISYYLCQKNN